MTTDPTIRNTTTRIIPFDPMRLTRARYNAARSARAYMEAIGATVVRRGIGGRPGQRREGPALNA
jgi:hypothetical protein